MHCNGTCSNTRTVRIGVPQGSVLGPLLFMLFVNDMPQYIVNGRCSMYAGDSILYCNGIDVPRVISSLRQCINCASRWYTAKRLVLNTAKCSVRLYYLAHLLMTEKKAIANFISQTREYSKITKYLGVDVDESLKFDVQVNNLTVKLAKLIGWLYRQTEKNITNKPIACSICFLRVT